MLKPVLMPHGIYTDNCNQTVQTTHAVSSDFKRLSMSNMTLQKIVFTSNSVGYSCSFKGRNFILMKTQEILGSCFAVHVAKLPDKISTSATFV